MSKRSLAKRGRVAASFSLEDCELLVAAAFLHDVGYAPSLNRLGFHPVDGARFFGSWSGAAGLSCRPSLRDALEAEDRGLVDDLVAVGPPIGG